MFWKLIKRRRITLQPSGEHHDLTKLYQEVNQGYFEGKLDLKITWSGSKRSKPKRRIRFGSYHAGHKLIRIHRRLDDPTVPIHFISYVIYHEMLHHVLPPLKRGGSRRIHHKEFVAREKQFTHYKDAKQWMANTLLGQ